MLDYLGFKEEAERFRTAIDAVYREGRALTPDQGGRASTGEFVKAVKDRM